MLEIVSSCSAMIRVSHYLFVSSHHTNVELNKYARSVVTLDASVKEKNQRSGVVKWCWCFMLRFDQRSLVDNVIVLTSVERDLSSV